MTISFRRDSVVRTVCSRIYMIGEDGEMVGWPHPTARTVPVTRAIEGVYDKPFRLLGMVDWIVGHPDLGWPCQCREGNIVYVSFEEALEKIRNGERTVRLMFHPDDDARRVLEPYKKRVTDFYAHEPNQDGWYRPLEVG